MKRYSDYQNWCKRNNKVVDGTSLNEYVRLYSYDQILIGLEPSLRKNLQEDINKLDALIKYYLGVLGVPAEDIDKNYYNIIVMFFNWLVGRKAYKYDATKDSQAIIDIYDNISYNKGFYFYGNSGVGKTTFLDAVSLALNDFNKDKNNDPIIFYSHQERHTFCPIKVRANQMTRNYSIGGYVGVIEDGEVKRGGIDQFFQPRPNLQRIAMCSFSLSESRSIAQVHEKIGCYPCLYIDDFQWGHTANNTSSYGNPINVIEEVIKNRYDENMLTFATSNVRPQDVTDATKDRLRAQFNLIIFDRTESFRK